MRPLLQALRSLRQDRRGVSAVEFALIAPVLILVYFGLAELSTGLTAKQRVSHATSAVGDLVAQADKPLSTSDLDNIFTAARTIVAPFPTAKLGLQVTSITGDASGKPLVDWSDVSGTGLTKRKKNDPVDLPPGLIDEPGETVIMAEATYAFDSPVGYVLPDGLVFNDHFYLRPRSAAQVTCTDCS
jgi:Flp pilus assembly protein TadG